MSSRVPGSSKLNAVPFRQDDDRKRDEARFVTLQNQLDELRQALRELASRQVRIEEGVKGQEGYAAQNRLTLDSIKQETQQSSQARALDENRTRQVIADLEQRLDDATRPIRSLQAHVSELLEASRRKTDDTGQHQKRYDELRAMIEHLSAVGDRNAVVTHQLRDSIDNVRGETDQLRRDILRGEDAIKIVDQEARRRVAEIAQVGENFTARLDELRSDVTHTIDMMEEYRRSIVHIDPSLQELREVDTALKQDVARFHSQAIERHEVLVDRLEDVRQAADGQFAEIRQGAEQRYERLGERIDEINELYRDLGLRISAVAHQLDELRLVDASIRRDMWHLHEQRVRMRLEQAQAELDHVTGQRRTGDTEPSAPSSDNRQSPRPADR
jgi:chromosome segregation ATPase